MSFISSEHIFRVTAMLLMLYKGKTPELATATGLAEVSYTVTSKCLLQEEEVEKFGDE